MDLEDVEDLRPDQPREGARSKIQEWLQIQHIWYLEEWRGGDAENSAVWFDPLQVQQVGKGVLLKFQGFGLAYCKCCGWRMGYLLRSRMFGLAC